MEFPYLIIFLALVFDFYNGMNDAANSIATIVSTRVLTPGQAVAWAAFFNFFAAFVFGVSVATTIGKGIVDVSIVDNFVIFSGIVGAIILTASATHYGLPISVSHAIIGGYGGAAVAKAGFSALIISGYTKILIFVLLAPILGMVIALVFSIITLWIVRNKFPSKVDKYFRKLQLISSALFSLSHGSNDAQKTIGIITIVLFTNNLIGSTFYVPFWVIILSHFVIAMGTLIGGWKVIRTLGMRVTKLTPFGGFSAETSAGLTVIMATVLGIPVSTTHTITGAIIGVGSIHRFSAVRWGVAKNILWAWVLTIPLSAFFAMVTYLMTTYFTGQ
ncbi:MAG: inorganic phosphate transporter [Ignavibacteria bacterium RIFOXYB2_FULL_35_12]|nr:MAG: inorganic phosphate transporter [Ignavibacteria bacterium GWA2_36_19]OGU52437.1 MAG: inorganic phosphate transporter [Ignavibacteria bacterium GWC2_35_8]OGU63066.1 MAG: inorganic phosphate transporter [Ignavibacteria bacterium GWF2_35_20]OGU78063.1 MAG: inorganic phosphate transporter [Ignavibacteria bacterium RBG_16_35_7]OGU78638.1 MAG: inorganic phosphate transporter [Ignavibacteria bacterium RIFOXYA2_FULL_35_9]OGU88945.1 MAG: inorganic phosphate transporter [Ignavibacteria bacterium